MNPHDTELAELREKCNLLQNTIDNNFDTLAYFKQQSHAQTAINEIISISLQPIPLGALLKEILLLVLNISWIPLEEKGCIFLVNEKRDFLEPEVSHNLDEPSLETCDQAVFGRCLCGRNTQGQQLTSKNSIDHQSFIAGLTPKGHYHVPIVVEDGSPIGIFEVHVKHRHRFDPTEQQFLSELACTLANIIEHKRMDAQRNTLACAVESTGSIMLITNQQGLIEYVNPQFTAVTGYTAEEVMGRSPQLLAASETPDEIYQEMRNSVLSGKEWHGDFLNKKKNGQCFRLKSITSPIKDVNGDVSHIVSIQNDVTQEYESSKELTYQSSHDGLTGLVNRREFEIQIESLLSKTNRAKVPYVLMFLDLDHFKVVNDTGGHTAGDELLRQISMEFQSKVRKTDTLARLGGDEFGILMEHCLVEDGLKIANSILKSVMDYQFFWENQAFRIGVSIGMTAFTNETISATELMKRADAACYRAKELGRNRVHHYQKEDKELVRLHGEMHWVERINQALDEDRFILHAQPIVPLMELPENNHRYELLLRMVDSQGNVIEPGAFLPAAGRYNLMPKLDRWVIDHAISLLSSWDQCHSALKWVSINLSEQSIADEDFLNFILTEIQNNAVQPGRICFEIKETAAILNLVPVSHFISVLSELGCLFALDDFGKGLSSFGYLTKLKVDFLKIDGMLVKNILDDPIDYAMVKSINEVGQVMGMRTIATSVENDEIMEKLRSIGITFAQGYGIETPRSISAPGADVL